MLRMADAPLLPFDFRAFYKTVDGYAGELITLLDQSRTQYALFHQLQQEDDYVYAGDPTLAMLPPADKGAPPFLDFSPLQNALGRLEKTTGRLSDTLARTSLSGNKQDEVNRALVPGGATIAVFGRSPPTSLVPAYYLCSGCLYRVWRKDIAGHPGSH